MLFVVFCIIYLQYIDNTEGAFCKEQFVSSVSKTLQEDPAHVCLEWYREVVYTILSKHARDPQARFSTLSSQIAHC